MRTRFRVSEPAGAVVTASDGDGTQFDAGTHVPGDLFRLLAAVTHIGLLQHDLADAVVSVNDEAADLAGLKAEELAGYGWHRMWFPDDLDTVLGAYLDCRQM